MGNGLLQKIGGKAPNMAVGMFLFCVCFFLVSGGGRLLHFPCSFFAFWAGGPNLSCSRPTGSQAYCLAAFLTRILFGTLLGTLGPEGPERAL